MNTLLDNEHQELEILQQDVEDRIATLQEAMETGVKLEETKKNRIALNEITRNIETVIEEQRSMINKGYSTTDSYRELLRNSYSINHFERMNFERDIMQPLRRVNSFDDIAKMLLFPLKRPEFEKHFSIESLYSIQRLRDEKEFDEGLNVNGPDAVEENKDAIRNKRFQEICNSFFQFAKENLHFKFSDFIESLRMSDLFEFCIENALPETLISMYTMTEINVAEWKEKDKLLIEPPGEFDLSWCMSHVPGENLQMNKLKFADTGSICEFPVKKDGKYKVIEMTEVMVEVVL
jgi:hypothetical protein